MLWRRKILTTSKRARRKRRIFCLKCLGVLLLLAALVYGFLYLMSRNELLIQSVSVTGTAVLNEEELTRFVNDEIRGSYLALIPRSNVLLYPKQSIELGLLDTFKRIKDVHVELLGWETVHVDIEERKPDALWCGENRLKGVVPECHFLDEDGFIYAKAPFFSGDVYFRFYAPLPQNDPVGQSLRGIPEYRSFSFFLSDLHDLGVSPVELALRDENDYELYLKEGPRLLFGRDDDLENILSNFESALFSEIFEDQNPDSVEYFDLRFGNKVYYKELP